MSDLERIFAQQLRWQSLPTPETEYRFAAELIGRGPDMRKRLRAAGLQDWRFDFAWPERKIAAEIEGGTWARGRHTRGAGFEGDCRKYNAATLHGWRVFRFTGAMVKSGEALQVIEEALDERD